MNANALFEELKEPSLMCLSLFALWRTTLAEYAVEDIGAFAFLTTLESCYRALHHCLEDKAGAALGEIQQAIPAAASWKAVATAAIPWHTRYPPQAFPSDNDAWMLYGGSISFSVDLVEHERQLIQWRYDATHPDEEGVPVPWDNRAQSLLSRVRAIQMCYEAAIFAWQNDPHVVYELMMIASHEIGIWHTIATRTDPE